MNELRKISLRSAMWIMLIGTFSGILFGGFSTTASIVGNVTGFIFMAVLSSHAIKNEKILIITLIAFAVGYLCVMLGAGSNLEEEGFESTLINKVWHSITSSGNDTDMVSYMYQLHSSHWAFAFLSNVLLIAALSVVTFYGEMRHKIISLLSMFSQIVLFYLLIRLYNQNILDTEYSSVNNLAGVAQFCLILYTLIFGGKKTGES